jgi:3,4-dihydroxy 2-butanone 4-phosphate synthase/GTP cyclohydrolase II
MFSPKYSHPEPNRQICFVRKFRRNKTTLPVSIDAAEKIWGKNVNFPTYSSLSQRISAFIMSFRRDLLYDTHTFFRIRVSPRSLIREIKEAVMGSFNTIEEIVADLKAGRMVIIMDDEDRENEGDLMMAASHVTAQDINFMARYGRGLICLTLTRQRCQQLNLAPMVMNNTGKHTTNFTVSIEAAEGVTTGISAHDRAVTIQAAVAPHAKPSDIHQPGHIFPLMAVPGGVLARAGHTEAGCDLARMAGLEPAAVIVEILNEDGTMARRDDLVHFAREHQLKMGTVADLIDYRIRNEQSIERIGQSEFTTEFGHFQLIIYQDNIDMALHLALVKGQPDPSQAVLVRVHMENTLSDLLSGPRPEGGLPLRNAMYYMSNQESGVIVVLRKANKDEDLLRALGDLNHLASIPAHTKEGADDKMRTYGIGAQILKDLGIHKMRVLGLPKKMNALSGFGLEVVDYLTPTVGEEKFTPYTLVPANKKE